MAKIGINIATGSLQQNDIIVGIDLGTTNSLVAVMHPATKQPIALKEFDGSSMVPSVVHFDSFGNPEVGEVAKKYLEIDPSNTIFSAKRLMGKSYNDIRTQNFFFTYSIIDNEEDKLVKVQVAGKFYSPIDLSALILKTLKERAEHILKTTVSKAVITVPAYFNDTQRQATRDAGKLAGLDVLRIINEPTAASLAYGFGLAKEEEKTIAVYDLGGGTFDISILKIDAGIFEVISTHGDTYLGGDDIDRAIIHFWMNKYQISEDVFLTSKEKLQAIRLLAEDAKKTLSNNPTVTCTWENQPLTLSIDEFNLLLSPIVEKTLLACSKALSDAAMSVTDIDEIIMVGGSTRIPFIKTSVGNFFNKSVNDSVNPDEVVAIGASIQADILAGNNKDFLLLDITPLSMGIETMGGLMDVLIPRNSKIPQKAARQYTTQKDGQTGINIAVYQGERDMVKDNRKLAEFVLTGIPSMPAGIPKIEISFLINADGILTVSALELRSGVKQSIEIKPQYGLTDEKVELMLLDSINHAQQDIQLRALVEAQTEAKQLLEITEKFIHKNLSKLTASEISTAQMATDALKKTIENGGDKNLIQSALEHLNTITRPFSERIMDETVKTALQGKKVD